MGQTKGRRAQGHSERPEMVLQPCQAKHVAQEPQDSERRQNPLDPHLWRLLITSCAASLHEIRSIARAILLWWWVGRWTKSDKEKDHQTRAGSLQSGLRSLVVSVHHQRRVDPITARVVFSPSQKSGPEQRALLCCSMTQRELKLRADPRPPPLKRDQGDRTSCPRARDLSGHQRAVQVPSAPEVGPLL